MRPNGVVWCVVTLVSLGWLAGCGGGDGGGATTGGTSAGTTTSLDGGGGGDGSDRTTSTTTDSDGSDGQSGTQTTEEDDEPDVVVGSQTASFGPVLVCLPGPGTTLAERPVRVVVTSRCSSYELVVELAGTGGDSFDVTFTDTLRFPDLTRTFGDGTSERRATPSTIGPGTDEVLGEGEVPPDPPEPPEPRDPVPVDDVSELVADLAPDGCTLQRSGAGEGVVTCELFLPADGEAVVRVSFDRTLRLDGRLTHELEIVSRAR